MTKRLRRLLVIAGAAVGVLLISGGWFAASILQSPAQREAAARPPAPKPIVAEVTEGDLERIVTVPIALVAEATQSFALPQPRDASLVVVTDQRSVPGGTLKAGDVVTVLNGRPIFAMVGTFPFYRDLALGMEGPDVAQLQRSLTVAGYPIDDDGRFGRQTMRAVESLYEAADHNLVLPPPAPTANSPAKTVSGPETETPTSDVEVPESLRTPVVPMSELVVSPVLPARVASTPSVGTVVNTETALALEFGGLVARAEVGDSAASQLASGMPAHITLPNGDTVTAEVSDVAPSTGNSDEGEKTSTGSTSVTLTLGGEIADDYRSQRLHASIVVAILAQSALQVPASAVVAESGGRSHVLKRETDGSFRRVAVTEKAVLEGRSAIEPSQQGALKAGDVVRVG